MTIELFPSSIAGEGQSGPFLTDVYLESWARVLGEGELWQGLEDARDSLVLFYQSVASGLDLAGWLKEKTIAGLRSLQERVVSAGDELVKDVGCVTVWCLEVDGGLKDEPRAIELVKGLRGFGEAGILPLAILARHEIEEYTGLQTKSRLGGVVGPKAISLFMRLVVSEWGEAIDSLPIDNRDGDFWRQERLKLVSCLESELRFWELFGEAAYNQKEISDLLLVVTGLGGYGAVEEIDRLLRSEVNQRDSHPLIYRQAEESLMKVVARMMSDGGKLKTGASLVVRSDTFSKVLGLYKDGYLAVADRAVLDWVEVLSSVGNDYVGISWLMVLIEELDGEEVAEARSLAQRRLLQVMQAAGDDLGGIDRESIFHQAINRGSGLADVAVRREGVFLVNFFGALGGAEGKRGLEAICQDERADGVVKALAVGKLEGFSGVGWQDYAGVFYGLLRNPR